MILLFGDSIVAGYGLEAEDTISSHLQSLLADEGYEAAVVNAGVSGDTTAGGRTRLAWTLDRQQPNAVLLALGGNDVLRGLPPEVTRENLDAMLAELQKRNIPTVLSAVQAPSNMGVDYQQTLNGIYTDLAEKYEVPLYPFLIEDTFGKTDYMQDDGIHPNEAGAQLIARNLAEYLPETLSLSIN